MQKLNCTDPGKEFTSTDTPNSYGRRNKLFLRWKVRDRKYYSCKDQSSFPFFESKLMYKVHLKCLTGTRISRKIIMNGEFSKYLYISYSVKLYYMQKRGKIRQYYKNSYQLKTFGQKIHNRPLIMMCRTTKSARVLERRISTQAKLFFV